MAIGADYLIQGLMQRGMPQHIAQGFAMNFRDESGLNPGINETAPIVPGSRGGFGLAQWTGPRRRQLEAYAGQRGVDVANPDMQMDFLMQELGGSEKPAWQKILQATTPGAAAATIVNSFLRPAEAHRARREREYLGGGGLLDAAPQQAAQPAQGLLGMMAPMQKDERGLGQKFKDGLKDGSTWDAIAMGLNTMRGNMADQGLVATVGNRMEQREQNARINQTAQWLRANGREDLAAAIEGGMIDGATAFQAMQPKEAAKPVEINGQLVDPTTGQVLGDYRTPETPDQTADMQNYQFYANDEMKANRSPLSFNEWKMQTAASGGMPSDVQSLQWRAEQAGLKQGTPEYEAFVLSGGKPEGGEGPAAFQALHMQAMAAGFEPGTDQYKEFMATRGSGLVAEASAVGKANGEAQASAPGDYQTGQNALDLIASIRNDPARQAATGKSSLLNIIPGTQSYDFQQKVEQAKGGAFLTAVQTMKGLGALSNNEGAAATQAITRMNTASTEEGFLSALDDYEKIVRQGMDRAAARGGAPSQPVQQAAPQRRRYNPQTGAFE